ncbi:peptidylprolyl isomerase [Anaeromicropila herbilytica]|uniref:peptidylprolyl isomerase n=1 Tax=Anaeromicropila herbilytica TaxID=2785025 RepID=A0A7R7IBN7_9FIRM|nr:peptidylprolyl isomerase [Anaeromicropila herbilytica]BCN28971.1 hypothetical protein bsdtb5_02660 [Anaeromicropila herbilytica]
MRRVKYILLVSTLLTALALTACKNGANKENAAGGNIKYELKGDLTNRSLILTVNDIQVGYDEVSVYMQELKNNYEDQFGSSIWRFDLGNGKTFEEQAKQEVIDQIVQMKIMGLKAKELGVKLTQDEKDEIASEVRKYMSSISDKYIKEHAVTDELISKVYSDNYLASKVFDVATNNVDTNISNDEAKQITTWQIFIQTSGKDQNDKEVNLSEEEKKAALKKVKKLLKEAKKTDDFYTLAEENTDAVDVEDTFGKGEKEKAVEDASFALKKGQMSDIVKGENGYYIIYCVSDNDEDATANKKEEIIAERQDKEFQSLYKKWSKDFKIAVNETMWKKAYFVDHNKEDKTVTEIDNK